jgi:hypothetical protein
MKSVNTEYVRNMNEIMTNAIQRGMFLRSVSEFIHKNDEIQLNPFLIRIVMALAYHDRCVLQSEVCCEKITKNSKR